jgi:hypothetical protein
MSDMVYYKNSFGALGDDERRPPRLTAKEKNKKVMTKKKNKRSDADVETAVAVAASAERAERGVGVRIEDHLTALQRTTLEEEAIASGSPRGTTILAGRRVSLADPVKETKQPQGKTEEPQIEQQAEQEEAE